MSETIQPALPLPQLEFGRFNLADTQLQHIQAVNIKERYAGSRDWLDVLSIDLNGIHVTTDIKVMLGGGGLADSGFQLQPDTYSHFLVAIDEITGFYPDWMHEDPRIVRLNITKGHSISFIIGDEDSDIATNGFSLATELAYRTGVSLENTTLQRTSTMGSIVTEMVRAGFVRDQRMMELIDPLKLQMDPVSFYRYNYFRFGMPQAIDPEEAQEVMLNMLALRAHIENDLSDIIVQF